MARKISIQMTDDLDGQTPADETVEFSIDGITYEIDLSTTNANKLRESLKTWVNASRKVSGRTRTRRTMTPGHATSNKAELAAIRAWAHANGVKVSSRGRISRDIVAKYHAAHDTPPITFSNADTQ